MALHDLEHWMSLISKDFVLSLINVSSVFNRKWYGRKRPCYHMDLSCFESAISFFLWISMRLSRHFRKGRNKSKSNGAMKVV